MNQPPVDMVLLQTFYEVARTGSVTDAAENLERSQPAISHRLRLLEADFGVRLFEKVGRRLRLTEYGRRLQTECLDLMARSQHLREQVVRSKMEIEGQVAVGTLPTVASHLLVPALRGLLERHPGIALRFSLGHVSPLCNELRTGELDVLVLVGSPEPDGLDVTPIGEVSLVAVMAPALAPARRGSITVAQLRKLRYLAYGERDPTFDVIDRYAKEHGLEGPHTPHIPHIEALRELAAAEAGYALLPEYTVRRDQELGRLVGLRAQGLDTALPVAIVARRNQEMTPALKAVHKALYESEAQASPLRGREFES
ncbi:MAG: LysR family transcriptional regulator [Longimicrobiales bacterium]